MAASATLALNAGAWVRRARLVMVAPDPRHTRRSQAETPLIDLSEFGQPPLPYRVASCNPQRSGCPDPRRPMARKGSAQPDPLSFAPPDWQMRGCPAATLLQLIRETTSWERDHLPRRD